MRLEAAKASVLLRDGFRENSDGKLIEQANRPAGFGAQQNAGRELLHEFKGFFPGNAVRYFVSYTIFTSRATFLRGHLHRQRSTSRRAGSSCAWCERSLFERRDV